VGLYAGLVAQIIYAVLGTSRPLSVTTSATLAIPTAAELGQVAPKGIRRHCCTPPRSSR
jgi:MFS superfamily sulfate permease-like transporter